MSRSAVIRSVLLVVAVVVVVWGVVAGLADPPTSDRVHAITRDLRCPTCEAESVADSMSQSARDITDQVREQVAAGWTDDQIRSFYVDRFGAWILLEPPRSGASIVLWLLPAAVLTGGAIVAAGRLAPGRHRTVLTLSAVVLGVGLSAGLVVSGLDDRSEQLASPPSTSVASVDLRAVTVDEMEDVVAANPAVIGMRLALAERYLEQGRVDDALRHTAAAVDLPGTDQEYQRALRLHGWTAALSGAPASGATFLRAALALSPDDRDAWWFLARVEFSGLGDAEAAAEALGRIDPDGMTDDQRSQYDEMRRLVDDAIGQGS